MNRRRAEFMAQKNSKEGNAIVNKMFRNIWVQKMFPNH